MNWPLFFAFLSPAIWAFINVFDTCVLKSKVKHVLSFAVISGIVNILVGLIMVSFLDWSGYSFFDLKFSILAGAMLGLQLYFYYHILAKHDASNAIGLVYIYPIIVALLSFLFLNEKLSLLGYLGIFITLIGVVSMTIRLRKLNISMGLWSIGVVAITSALNEFFIKVATIQLPEWHGASINLIVMGILVLPALLKKSVRKGFVKELKNTKYVYLSEILTLIAVSTIYLAMNGLSATIVSVISVTQPLFVLIFETIAVYFGFKIINEFNWKHKLFSILLIVMGIIIMYLSDVRA